MSATANERANTKAKTGGEVGDLAPDFVLPDADGREWRLSEQRGKVVVLLFYPGDETPTCTKQLCSVRDRWADYQTTKAEIVGISTDSVESHKSFAANHKLPLRLLSDKGGRVTKLFKAGAIVPGKSARAVFVIDADGIIRHRNLRSIVGLFVPPKDDETIAIIKSLSV
ncbi:MAG: hypothetical protein NVSMB56_13140 [Pyrinomonadaceae bacterium]